MLGYLSKFVLQMLPTISATVIGAYIVATWINPKTPPDPAKIAAKALAQQSANVKGKPTAKAPPATDLPAPEVAAAPVEPKAVEPAVETATPAENAKPVKAAAADSIRVIPIVKQAPAAEASVAVPPPETTAAVDERKDAAELARAALQRLRGSTDTVRAPDELVKPGVPPARVQQARAAPEPMQAMPTAAVAPPLPPAVSISSPRYLPAESQDQVSADAPDRLTPPGEIPVVRAPLKLQATRRVSENPTIADDFVSATKSFFRAITPN